MNKKEFKQAMQDMSVADMKNAMWNDYQRVTELRTKLTHYKEVMDAAKRCVAQDQRIRNWPYLYKDAEHPLSKELQKHGALMLELKEVLKEAAND